MALKSLNSDGGFGLDSGNVIIDSNGNVAANSLSVLGTSNLGPISNITITGGSNGQAIVTDGLGNLTFTTISGTSNHAAPMPYYIPSAESYTVTENFQGLFYEPIEIDGAFEVSGILIDISGASGGGGNGTPGGSNTQVQFNDAGIFGGNSTFTFNKTAGIVTTPNLVVVGNVTPSVSNTYSLGNNTNRFNNLYLAGNTIVLGNATISANSTTLIFTNPNGDVFEIDPAGVDTLGNISAAGNVVSQSNISAVGNLTGGNIITGGMLSATGTISGGNISTAGDLAVTGNGSFGNISTTGTLNVVANTNLLGNLFVKGNTTFDSLIRVGNPNAETKVTLYPNGTASVNLLTVTASGSQTGNISAANLTVTGITTVNTINSVGNLNTTGNVTAGNVSGTDVSGTTLGGTLTTAAQPNITSVGILSSLNVTGNTSVGNLSTAGKVAASILESNVATGTAPLTVSSTTKVSNLNADLLDGFDTDQSTSANTIVVRNADGNIVASNALLGNLATANYVAGTLTTAAQPNITSVGTLTSLSVTGNVTAGNVSGTDVSGTTLGGTLTTAAQPNITSVGTLTSLAVTGNVTAGNVSGTDVSGTTLGGTLTTAAQPNITSVGTLIGLAVNGNITAANITANTGVFTGNGSGLSAIAGANVTGQVANALVAGTVYTAAQPNITSVGTLSSLSVTGNVAAGNLTTTGILSVTGTGVSSIAGNLDMTSNNIINLASPVNATDAATKQYVDEVAEGLRAKPAAYVATTTNLTSTYNNGTSGVGATLTSTTNGQFPLVDGYQANTTTGFNGVLVKNQTNPAENGRYNLTTLGDGSNPWVLTRCSLCDTSAEIPGSYIFVTEGDTLAGTGWVLTVANPATFTIGTDAIIVVQFAGAGTYTAGTGLTLTGTTFSVNASQTQITSVGTLTGLNVNGTVTATAFTANTGVFTGNGSGLSAIAGGNVTGQVANALVAGTVYTASQPNITSVGTLTGLGVNGTVTAVNITANTGVFTGNGSALSALNASNISSGTLAQARLANSSLTVNGTAISLGGSGTITANTTATLTRGTYLTGSNFNGGTATTWAVDATTTNTASKVVARDANGSFSANIITATLSGAATTAGTVTTATQPNITSVGTLANLLVDGDLAVGISDGNLLVGTTINYGYWGNTFRYTKGVFEYYDTATVPNNANVGLAILNGDQTNLNYSTLVLGTRNGWGGNPIGMSSVYSVNRANSNSGNPTGAMGFAVKTSESAGLAERMRLEATGLTVTGNIISTTGSFTGNGAGITTINASNISSGTLAQARLANSSLTVNGTAIALGSSGTVTANTPNSVTFNNGGSGAAAGTTFNGGAAITVSYNTVGAPSTTGTNASGTWGISITGSANSASTATTATTAINQSGGTVSATSATSTGQLLINYNIATPTNYVNGLQQEIRATSGTAGIGLHRSGFSHCGIYHDASDTLKFNMNSGTCTLNANAGTILGSGNYNSYAPTLTGGGASGTWNITSNYTNNLTQGFNSNWNTDFQQAPAGSTILRGDTSSGSSPGGPGGTWWFQQNMRHTNGSNFWGVQVAWGWEDNANILRTRNVQAGSYGSWVTYLNSSNYSSYALPLSGGTMSGQITTRQTTGTTPIVSGVGSNSLQVMGDTSNGAWFSFHRAGAYAINMGLDTSNVLRCGGWSDGANYRWQSDTSGNFTARADVTAYSDERLKKDWAPVAEDFVERLASIKSGTYTRTDIKQRQAGVSAQAWQKLLAETVQVDDEGILSLAYGNAALVSAVELAKRIVEQEERIKKLETLVEKLMGA